MVGSQVVGGGAAGSQLHTSTGQQQLALRCCNHLRRPRPAQAGLKVMKTVRVATTEHRNQNRNFLDMTPTPESPFPVEYCE